MELHKDKFHYKWYKLWYWETETNNFCAYFWAQVMTLLLTVLLLPGMVFYNLITKDYLKDEGKGERFLFMILFTFSIYIVSALLGAAIGYAIYYPIFALQIIGGITIIIGMVWLVFEFSSKIKNSETVKVISEGKRSFMESYCPKIDWKQ